ncbi:hypothetical protein UPYG_G00037000 [Umbra pygmaea]|uniref:Spermatogenesis-associated protein 1 C-terminal domain-containing protein n=1 Tax=Umbra pygmaea TaxID=75934 RepID=A0ABD0Y7W4_UMBPY
MAQSNESVRYSEERRPTTSKFVELHVLFVPDEKWNFKLNKVPVEAIESFISAGLIRVYPEITLKALRSELGILLGAEREIQKFSFLKCVGRSLALVKAKQERDLKVKAFAPPYAPQPELYLLPLVESEGSVWSQSLTPDNYSTSTVPQTYCPDTEQGIPTGTKEPVKFPLIPKGPQLPLSSSPSPDDAESRLEEEMEALEEDEEQTEEEGCSSTEEQEEKVLSCQMRRWAKHDHLPRKSYTKEPPVPGTESKMSDMVKTPHAQKETSVKQKQNARRNKARDSGVPESVEDQDSVFSLSQDRFRKSKDAQTIKYIRNKPNIEVPKHPIPLAVLTPAQYGFPPTEPALSNGKTTAQGVLISRDELMEEIKMAKEERKQLEQTRQDLLRKGKDLLAQNRHRQNQARDSWKRRYFDTKKATALLEVKLRDLRQELEKFYNKLLIQLQARDGRGKIRRQGRLSSTKNELIIQIMTESHEIDNLKRKVDDAKMKLVTEIKLRKQAATELKALKAELSQKKTQTVLSDAMGSLGLGVRDTT